MKDLRRIKMELMKRAFFSARIDCKSFLENARKVIDEIIVKGGAQ